MAHHSGIDELALSGQTTKSQILSKALALFDVVSQAKSEKKRVGWYLGPKHTAADPDCWDLMAVPIQVEGLQTFELLPDVAPSTFRPSRLQES